MNLLQDVVFSCRKLLQMKPIGLCQQGFRCHSGSGFLMLQHPKQVRFLKVSPSYFIFTFTFSLFFISFLLSIHDVFTPSNDLTFVSQENEHSIIYCRSPLSDSPAFICRLTRHTQETVIAVGLSNSNLCYSVGERNTHIFDRKLPASKWTHITLTHIKGRIQVRWSLFSAMFLFFQTSISQIQTPFCVLGTYDFGCLFQNVSRSESYYTFCRYSQVLLICTSMVSWQSVLKSLFHQPTRPN